MGFSCSGCTDDQCFHFTMHNRALSTRRTQPGTGGILPSISLEELDKGAVCKGGRVLQGNWVKECNAARPVDFREGSLKSSRKLLESIDNDWAEAGLTTGL